MSGTTGSRVVGALALLLLSTGGLQGQSIHGRVLVEGDTAGIEGVTLSVVDSTGAMQARLLSDSLGAFRAALDDPGRYRVLADRLGFKTSEAVIVLQENELVELEVRMAEQAIPLEPMLVVARRKIRRGTLDEFYDRMTRMKKKGQGYFIEREEIENRGGGSLPVLLTHVPGVYAVRGGDVGSGLAIRMRRPGRYCTPLLYIDGRPQDYSRMPEMEDLEGMEIYRGRFEWVDGYGASDCGMIFAWRKSDWGDPFSPKRAIAFGGLAALFLVLVF